MADVPEFTFVRPPLQDASKQIRLLQIQLTKKDFPNEIHCTLSVHNLDDVSDDYVAISYTWGSPDQPVYVYIDNQRAQVRFNCWHALWQMRHHEVQQYYWLDSLCIDQECHGEKSLQIVRMGDIYRRASRVAICLGECNDSGFHEYLQQYSSGQGSSAFTVREKLRNWLSDQPYFHRLWTLQECLFAKSAEIFYGSSRGEVSMIAEALRLKRIESRSHSASLSLRNALLPRHTVGTYDLASLICDHRDRRCFEPRDQIYGLLSLTSPHLVSLIVVDYKLPLVNVLDNYIQAHITFATVASSANPPLHMDSVFLDSVSILVREFAAASDDFAVLLNIRHCSHIAHAVADRFWSLWRLAPPI